ncbi:MAG: hypothetical protein ACLGPL_05540, partial [Acidobacteriota bacterium]
LKILIQIRDNTFHKLSQLERTRLSNPFRSQHQDEGFTAVTRMLAQIPKLEKVRDVLNPDHLEGHTTPILENIPKLSLFGFTPVQLREILLIVVGHTTMSRIVFGKVPAKTLKTITDKAKEGNHQFSLDLLRICRLMSMAEIVAALGDTFTGEQSRELYRLYDDAINVATDNDLDWDKLHDLRISALGGVQNKAVREMMKLFNLFEFLDDWQEYLRKGPFEKEVICDYQADQLQRMEEALALVRMADRFKHQFMGDYIFGQSYFFRQFLDSEFHGTGHLFPALGTAAGFVLLWIAVNSSERHVINFNPMMAGSPIDRDEARLAKIKKTLLRIPIDKLQPTFFDEIKETLADGRPAFIFDSGIRIINNLENRAIDIYFVDVEENLQQIDSLLAHMESKNLRGVSLKDLQELERRFSELESFHQYVHREGCTIQCGIFERSGGLEAKDREIGEMEQRLKSILQTQIFIPDEIWDSIHVLSRHAPEVLRFILPEFQALAGMIETRPTFQPLPLSAYVMRCLEKFQALAIKDREAFQDRNVFYQLAKQEFGPLAEEGIGATHSQMDVLEYLVDRVQQRPLLYKALTLSLLFQEIGKIERYGARLLEAEPRLTHAEQGALVLERSEILSKYKLDGHVEKLVILLVRYHGLVGHVIRGEEPTTALEQLTLNHDERLLDVFVIHSVIAAAAVREGIMVSDRLEAFLTYRSIALQIIRSSSDWMSWLRDSFRRKGSAVLEEFQLTAPGMHVFPQTNYCGFTDRDIEDEALWHGRQSAALERLLRLLGISWVDYQDLQMYQLKMPVNFIYHKKKLKSVGPAAFQEHITKAGRLLEVISSLSPEVRYYLLYCLDHLGGAFRVYDFHPLSSYLEIEECLKLLLISFQALHHHFGTEMKYGLISYRSLSQNITRRHEVLQRVLKDLPFPQSCFEEGRPLYRPQDFGEITFKPSTLEPAVRVDYHDAVQFDIMVRSLMVIWDHNKLSAQFANLIQELRQKLPYDTKSFEEELEKFCEDQKKKINDRILKTIQERLNKAKLFSELSAIRQEIEQKQTDATFTEEQRFVLREIFEFHRSRLRDLYLDSIYREINSIHSRDDLTLYWDRIKHELFAYRYYVGKEYESLIGHFIDSKAQAMEAGKETLRTWRDRSPDSQIR